MDLFQEISNKPLTLSIYEDILRFHSKENKYIDPVFNPHTIEIRNKENIEWIRIEEEYENNIFDYKPTSDIKQGRLGNCPVIGTFMYLDQHPDLVRSIFHDVIEVEKGVVCIYFCYFGEKIPVIIDTLIPFQRGKPLFARPKYKSDSYWACLVEKAYAKILGSYYETQGGSPELFFRRLFGWCDCNIGNIDDIPEYEQDGLFYKFVEAFNKKCMLCAAIYKCDFPDYSSWNPAKDLGLVFNHTFVIMNIKEIGNLKLINLKNPWCCDLWKGDYSKNSKKWTKELKKQCGYANDHSFWLSWRDFTQYFKNYGVYQDPSVFWKVQYITGVLETGERDNRSPFSGYAHTGNVKQWRIHFTNSCSLGGSFEYSGNITSHILSLEKNNGKKTTVITNNDYRSKISSNNFFSFDWIIDDCSQDWTLTISRMADAINSSYYLCFRCDHDFSIIPIKDPEYESLHKISGEGILVPGNTDGRSIFKKKPGVKDLKQWKIKFPKECEAHFVFKKTGRSKHTLAIQRIDRKISYVFGNYLYFNIPAVSASEYWTWEIDDFDHEWSLVVSRDEDSISSAFCFDIYCESPLSIECFPDIKSI